MKPVKAPTPPLPYCNRAAFVVCAESAAIAEVDEGPALVDVEAWSAPEVYSVQLCDSLLRDVPSSAVPTAAMADCKAFSLFTAWPCCPAASTHTLGPLWYSWLSVARLYQETGLTRTSVYVWTWPSEWVCTLTSPSVCECSSPSE